MPLAPDITAVLMPITLPSRLTRGPPEFQGLIEASVCRKSEYTRSPLSDGTARPRAESTPEVTVRERPNGLPIATTVSPIRRSALRPSGCAGRPLPATLRTARSESRSEPTTSASSSRPSNRVIEIFEAPLDDVGVGDHQAGGVDDQARAQRLGAPAGAEQRAEEGIGLANDRDPPTR